MRLICVLSKIMTSTILGVLCTPTKIFGGAQAPSAPPSYAYAVYTCVNCLLINRYYMIIIRPSMYMFHIKCLMYENYMVTFRVIKYNCKYI